MMMNKAIFTLTVFLFISFKNAHADVALAYLDRGYMDPGFDAGSNADPYVEITVNSVKMSTPVYQDTTFPVFQLDFSWTVSSPSFAFLIEILDSDLTSPDSGGTMNILSSSIGLRGVKTYVDQVFVNPVWPLLTSKLSFTVAWMPDASYSHCATAVSSLGGVNGFFRDSLGTYSINMDCTYSITVPAPAVAVRLTFYSFSTEATHDYVTILNSDSTTMATISGKPAVMPTFVSSDRTMTVRFTSDFSINDAGFLAYYEAVYAPSSSIASSSSMFSSISSSESTSIYSSSTSYSTSEPESYDFVSSIKSSELESEVSAASSFSSSYSSTLSFSASSTSSSSLSSTASSSFSASVYSAPISSLHATTNEGNEPSSSGSMSTEAIAAGAGAVIILIVLLVILLLKRRKNRSNNGVPRASFLNRFNNRKTRHSDLAKSTVELTMNPLTSSTAHSRDTKQEGTFYSQIRSTDNLLNVNEEEQDVESAYATPIGTLSLGKQTVFANQRPIRLSTPSQQLQQPATAVHYENPSAKQEHLYDMVKMESDAPPIYAYPSKPKDYASLSFAGEGDASAEYAQVDSNASVYAEVDLK